MMKLTYVALCALALTCRLPAATVIVNGSANIFGAGHATTPNPGGPFSDTVGFTGTLPTVYNLLAGLPVLRFPDISGSVGCCSDQPANGAEGGTAFPLTDINSLAGISGIRAPGSMFLVGVFLSNTEPTGIGPSRLDFTTGAGVNFASLAPSLNQIFFIGNGLRNDNTTLQSFVAPTGATRLYMGFVDGMGFVGNPGAYADNTGFLSVGINQYGQTPEPASMLLLLSGAAALCVARKFRKPKLD